MTHQMSGFAVAIAISLTTGVASAHAEKQVRTKLRPPMASDLALGAGSAAYLARARGTPRGTTQSLEAPRIGSQRYFEALQLNGG
jgi:hypothetical protein